MTSDNPLANLLEPTSGQIAPAARISGRSAPGDSHELPDPATGQPYAHVGWAGASLVEEAVKAADDAFAEWAETPPRERAAALRAIAGSLRDNAEQLGDLIVHETGKRRVEAVGEALFSANCFDWFADAATPLTEQHLTNSARRFVVRRHPVGVVAAVSPWNFPLSIPARKVAPALAAGCPVVQKPSELTPLSTLALTAICERYLPSGVVGAVIGDGEKLTTALVDHPAVASVTFTGSTRTGSLVAARATDSMTRVTMELGGKAPFVVCADADPDVALDALLVAKFRNNGASCIAANNVFIHESRYPAMVALLRERVAAMQVGDPRAESTELGPLVRPGQVDRVVGLVDDAESRGCAVTRGSVGPGHGYFAAPAVVEATEDVGLWRQEIFGPALAVRPFSDEDAVVHEVNGWRTGLGGYVISSDAQHGLDLAARLRIGIIGINNGAPNTPEVPFGGFGFGGIGREGGFAGLLEFTEEQTLSLAR